MILCCGEALIDMLPVPDGFAPHAGGSVYNTAIALGRLGAKAGFFWGLSADFFGDQLRAGLKAAGVDTGACVTAPRPCTLAFVRLVEGQASYAFYDENTAGRMLTTADLPDVNAQALFFGGISLVAEPCGSAMEALCLREAANCVVMVDPNIRPGFITDAPAVRARLARMLVVADIVKLSGEDLDWLAPDRAGFIAGLLAGGTRLVCVTEGAGGVRAHTAQGSVFEPARPVTVADTVGAGDTFNAGLLAALQAAGVLTKAGLAALDVATLHTALRRGVQAAAVTVARAGANPPWAHELD
ncbi:MAG: carbohydrate kinase [Gemmobacter sp.]|nr:carbohydrate kinase [Gemmobacter sp.]